MSYIGKTPTPAPLTSSDITDGIISTAKIANDAATLAKMAQGTDGNLISYDASGNPVAVATGNDGQVLTSTGAGSPPVFENAAGGAWSKLVTTTVSSNTAAVEFNSTYLNSTYRDYRIIISDMHHSTGSGAYPELQIGNGSSYITNGDYRFAMRAFKSDASTNQEVSQATSQFKLSADTIAGNDSNKKSSFEITMFDPLSTSSFFTLQATGSFIATSGDLACGQYGGGFFNGQQGTAINLVKIFMNTGSINAGTFTLYGRKI